LDYFESLKGKRVIEIR